MSIYPGSLDKEEYGCYKDTDRDGYGDMLAEAPYDSGRDCDDTSASIYPGSARYEPSSQCF